jgi:hypothetical protein
MTNHHYTYPKVTPVARPAQPTAAAAPPLSTPAPVRRSA